jgi:hypothetical protein
MGMTLIGTRSLPAVLEELKQNGARLRRGTVLRGRFGTASQFWMSDKPVWSRYGRGKEYHHELEKKGKCFSSVAPIICRPKNDRTESDFKLE